MREVLLLKCGELVLKGLNRGRFESRLLHILRARLAPLGDYRLSISQSTIYVEPQEDAPVGEALEVCRRVFGIVSLCRAAACPKEMGAICDTAARYLKDELENVRTFKVEARRADKRFPLTSPQIGAEVGARLLEEHPHLRVRMDGAERVVKVEIREQSAYISGERLPGAGGMPTGTNGRAMLLLSGGIDSPVAGHMMARRGLELGAVHFYSYPYTSEEARDKVIELARILSGWTGKLTVSVVPFTHIQQEIRQKCSEDYFTLVMRRFMMRLAERVARHQGCKALITGESLGQVASQTIESLNATGSVCHMPVFRPLIGMDKEEIVVRARQIGTFETSILPYEDCCTVFTPRHPQTKPRLENVEQQEESLDIEGLVDEAFAGIERITLG
ncbi:MAG TPA: tRNA 4-thiouridine(8) synthase ThiI [Candidatus Ventrousia excrementavium]|uniref:Probable tRNA sulfurtransferase n=1 Tax=Candidatus Ventrousia excrementavium TaxID=2840961 RepID=A0A9D1ITP2_9CLOT|nr:tRNA 4-thiouridine(8) synthase ThiI [Candidatus Ventrousia excrementavium]